jgi:phytol kinase
LLTELSHYVSIPSLWLSVGIVGIWLAIVLLVAEGLYRFAHADSEIARKVVHIGAGNVILLAWWLNIPAWVGIAAAIVASGVTLTSYFVPILSSINEIGRKSLGTFFYAVSVGILMAWFWTIHQPRFAVLGILTMTWGDGLAGLVGQRWGQHRYQLWGMRKSWEGSMTMVLISFIVSSMILLATIGNSWQIWVIAATVAVCAAGLEAFSKLGIDNLTVPIGSAALGFYLVEWLL